MERHKEGHMVFIASAEVLQGKEANMSLISWNPTRLERVQDHRLQQKLKRQQTAMTKLSPFGCA